MSLRQRNCEARPEEGSSRISQQINSPDPVEMVRQYEQDENLAKLLQAEFNNEMTGDSTTYISVDRPNVTIELSTSSNSIALSQSPLDYFSGDEEDSLLRDFGFQRDEELHDIGDVAERDGELRDDEVEDSEEDDIEIGDDEDDEIDEEEEDEDDEVGEDADDDEEEVDDVEEEDEDLDESEWVTINVNAVDRSRLFPEDIERLPTHINSAPTSSTGSDEAATMCQICHECYAKGDELRVLPCFHKFHSNCIDPWLLSSTTCPVCRIKVDLSEGAAKF